MIRAVASVVFLIVGVLYAQPVPAPRFEVAAIKLLPLISGMDLRAPMPAKGSTQGTIGR